MKERKALIIVDVQNDFVEGGSLAVTGGEDLAKRLARKVSDGWLNDYEVVVTTQDWHIEPGDHFAETPDFVDSWPVHCEAGEYGAEIVQPLKAALDDRVDYHVKKGQYEAAYSGFEGVVVENGKTLEETLKNENVRKVEIVGIASDYCVAKTAFSAKDAGFNTAVLDNYTAAISSERMDVIAIEYKTLGISLVEESL